MLQTTTKTSVVCGVITIKSVAGSQCLQCPTGETENSVSATVDRFRPQGICLDFKMNEEGSTTIQSVKGITDL